MTICIYIGLEIVLNFSESQFICNFLHLSIPHNDNYVVQITIERNMYMDKSLGLAIIKKDKKAITIRLINEKDNTHYRITDVTMSNNSIYYENNREHMIVTHSFVNDKVFISFKDEITEGSILKFVFRNEFNDMTIPMEWIYKNGVFEHLSRSDTQ